MPDLNWEYEPLRREIYDMLHFWIDMGVDGFRLDIFTRFKKPEGFPDTKKAPDVLLDRNGFVVDPSMCTNVEGIHEILHEMYTEVFGPRDCMTVGEGAGVSSQNAVDYVSQSREEIDMVYHFELSHRRLYTLTTEHFRSVQKRWAEVISHNAWPVQYLSNHDSARQVSCYGSDGEYRIPSAKLLATLIHTTPGTPFVYQGEEIGMTNVVFDSIEDYNCCYTVGDYHSMIKSGVEPKEAIRTLAPRSRDNARTPYQWDGSENAGFRFRDTLQPIVKVLCAVEETTTENPPSDTEVDALKNVVLLKETMIEELTAAKEKLEAMLADEASRHADCREMLNMYKEQLRILGDQIARKDRYIDFLLERVKN
jgi:oligo-1,6-glucosidase